MPNIADACDRIDKNTDRLSIQVRALALGLLAFSGGLLVSSLTGEAGKAPKLPLWLVTRLFCIGVVALLSLAADLAQYVSMYLYLRLFQRNLDDEISAQKKQNPTFDPKTLNRDYDEDDCRFRAALISFWVKILLLFWGIVWLVLDAFVLVKQQGQ